MKRLLIGNQAVAYGALEAGIEVASGYPGTPSSETLAEILRYAAGHPEAPYVEWSVNEKVAFEVASGAAWTGKRALVTMKMSGFNVASDSILSVAYSGTRGGLVLYVADDPGAEAGMPEQDTRLYAMLAGLPLLEPADPRRAHGLARFAFELSESAGLPVILRSVTSVAHARGPVEGRFCYRPLGRRPRFERDIFKYTKAGSAICLSQHQDLLERMGKAREAVRAAGINRIQGDGPLFAVACGGLIPNLEEALPDGTVSLLLLEGIYPLDESLVIRMLEHGRRILVLEELEPVVEMLIRSLASRLGWSGTILGKLDGLLPRTGRYGLAQIKTGLKALTEDGSRPSGEAAEAVVKHPITFCAGCPHRGTYMALRRALQACKLDLRRTIVTGDIGCTILGMNPPFDACWTEVSMGSSIGLAQGFFRAGVDGPVIAAIGDSTFFHAGLPPLINAVQHRSDLLVIILDNGWTSMTGFQANPGTAEPGQTRGMKRVEMAELVRGAGVDHLKIVNPLRQEEAAAAIAAALKEKGVRVIISREECHLSRGRRSEKRRPYTVDQRACTFCRACIRETGCPALLIREEEGSRTVVIDAESCTGCGLCSSCCPEQAIRPALTGNARDD